MRDEARKKGNMTQHEEMHQVGLIEEKIEELNRLIAAFERIKRELDTLAKRGNREQAFFAGRRSMAYELRESGGLSSGRLGMEILYLLPDDFVQLYGALFHRALNVGDESVMAAHGKGGVDKAIGRTGMATEHDERGRDRGSGAQASGTGKKWKEQRIPIGSEAMMRVKQGVDKELMVLASRMKGALANKDGEGKGEEQKGLQCINGVCRSFLKPGWGYCPRCGIQVKQYGGIKGGPEKEREG